MSTDSVTLRTERTLPFSPEAVYGAFADPALLSAWWGPEGFTNTFEAFDFREGGDWRFVMHGPNGANYANHNIFVALEPAARVVIRHDCLPYFTLTVELRAAPGGTHLRWAQAFDDAAKAEAVRAIVVPANEQNLDRLSRALREAPAPTP
jgi:uncharacterized protein YndB with AHSA1/START domain